MRFLGIEGVKSSRRVKIRTPTKELGLVAQAFDYGVDGLLAFHRLPANASFASLERRA
jgi:hypothetical protein